MCTCSIFSHFRPFSPYCERNWSSFFISRSISFSVIFVNADNDDESRKKDSALLLFSFLSESLGGNAIYHRNARVLVTRNFTTAYMNGWTYVCTHGRFFQNHNFFGRIDNQIFLPMVLPCGRFARAMSPLLQAITSWRRKGRWEEERDNSFFPLLI